MAATAALRTPIVLRSLVPTLPQEPGERAHLEEDLTNIGCIGLISKPWLVKDENMVWELHTGVSYRSRERIRQHRPWPSGNVDYGEVERGIWVQHWR